MTPFERSRAALPSDIRRTLEESNLPIEVATAIADLCEQRAEAAPSNAEWLSTLKCNSFHLTHDDEHAVNYVTAKEWIEEYQPKDFADVDPIELQAMKDTNTIWCLQIYPHTPVGFNVWYGATMDSVIAQARRDYVNKQP